MRGKELGEKQSGDERRMERGFYPPSAVSIIDWGRPMATAMASMASLRACWSRGLGSVLGSSFSPRGMSGSRPF